MFDNIQLFIALLHHFVVASRTAALFYNSASAHSSYVILENEQEHVCAYCVVQKLYSLRISSRINTYSHLNCIDDLSVLCGHIDKYLENRAHTYTHAYEPLVTRSSHKIFIFVPMIQNICK